MSIVAYRLLIMKMNQIIFHIRPRGHPFHWNIQFVLSPNDAEALP